MKAKTTMKRKEVLETLEISPMTLERYVKRGMLRYRQLLPGGDRKFLIKDVLRIKDAVQV